MFCYQCQETAGNKGCQFKRGVCGKTAEAADAMDLLIYALKGLAVHAEKLMETQEVDKAAGRFACKALFSTITNANFDRGRILALVKEALKLRDDLKGRHGSQVDASLVACADWTPGKDSDFETKSKEIGILSTGNEDVRSLRELLIYGLKGISAYATHAAVLGFEDEQIYSFIFKALVSTLKELSVDEMTGLVLEAGNHAVKTMELLDRANTSTYGNPEVTEVDIGVGSRPGILISGHDLKDMEELLEQSEGTGVDIYTHCEMLPAHYYPAFKKYAHFAGNYGGSWWHQNEEFEKFNGPILMTTNCIIPVRDSYKDRIFTTGMAGYPEVKHIPDGEDGKGKDFSEIIELAKKCNTPTELETGRITGGFAHNQVEALAEEIVEAVKSGKIKRFVVMAGCDGRHKERQYFTEVAEALPEGTVILTAGCAKYRYNKLRLGDIDGVPRVLDAGQCNDSYSLAVTALKLKEIFGVKDVNDLPISFDIAWYEQKAVAVLLALLALGFNNIRLGPTLPAFLSPNVAKVLVDKFDIKATGDVKEDVEAMMAAK